MARIRFINNDGGGFSDMVTIPDGQTVQEFLVLRGIKDASKYTVRHNQQECVLENDTLKDGDRLSAVPKAGTVAANERVLSENDRVSVTPKAIAGAVEALIDSIRSTVYRD